MIKSIPVVFEKRHNKKHLPPPLIAIETPFYLHLGIFPLTPVPLSYVHAEIVLRRSPCQEIKQPDARPASLSPKTSPRSTSTTPSSPSPSPCAALAPLPASS